MDNETLLFDRIEAIKAVNAKHDLLNNAYLSFSGGKDSTILHHLLDMALPGNAIPRVFIDTGIEYEAIRQFVLGLAENDDRFQIIKPSKPIKATLERYGYPFKSKEHSTKLHDWQQGSRAKNIRKYTTPGLPFQCPSMLLYQFTDDFKLKVSQYCCLKMKKEPAKKHAKEIGRSIVITGMRKEEGGQRTTLGCVVTGKDGKLKKFHPLSVVPEDWEEWFIERERELFSLRSTTLRSTSRGRVARVAHSLSIWKGSWKSCTVSCRMRRGNARPYGSPYTTNTEG